MIAFAALLCGVTMLLLPEQAGATALNGSFTGLGNATVSFSNLNFCPNGQAPNGANQGNACTNNAPAYGNITLAGGTAGTVYAGVNGNLNQIQSLSQALEPIGVLVNVPNWLIFVPAIGSPNVSLTATEVLPGSFPSAQCGAAPAGGQVCTPPGSGFNLSNQTASSSSASFQVNGNAVDGNPADTAPFTFIFTSQFTVPYQTLLAALSANSGTGNYSSSYSGTYNATLIVGVPEPVTLSLVGAGLLGLGVWGRKRQRS